MSEQNHCKLIHLAKPSESLSETIVRLANSRHSKSPPKNPQEEK